MDSHQDTVPHISAQILPAGPDNIGAGSALRVRENRCTMAPGIVGGDLVCCRYYVDDETPEMAEIVRDVNSSPLLKKWGDDRELKTHGEIRPADVAPVLAPDRNGAVSVFPMKWGYSGRSLLINARVETAAVRPSSREDWVRHRCIAPASWYFEWEHFQDKGGRVRTGNRYALSPAKGGMTWLCGLYRIEGGRPAFVILTREAGDGIRFIHDRMPLILPEDVTEEWIRPGTDPEALLDSALTDMKFEKR